MNRLEAACVFHEIAEGSVYLADRLWMIEELKKCVCEIQIRDELLVTSPDPKGLQHAETYLFDRESFRIKWRYGLRELNDFLHPTVIERLKADPVPQMGEVASAQAMAG